MKAFAFALACVALPFLVPEALAAVSGLATGPKLSVEKVGVNVLVEWPEDAIPDGYALESSSAISDLTWDRVPGVATNAILLSPGAITRYFRLSNAAAGGALLRGTVQTGGTASARPLPGLQVLLVEATEDRPLVVDQATSGPDGTFELRSPRVSSESVFVVTASLDGGVELVSALGPTLPSRITVNELTTVAASYAFAQFYRAGEIRGDASALRIAAAMNENLVELGGGGSSDVLLTSPNADESNSLRSTRALANLLASCVADPMVARQFFSLTADPRLPTPTTTSQAMASLARNPGENVLSIYGLTTNVTPYWPSLESAPDAWTVTVKVNDSGDDQYLIGGMGNIAFDHRGNAWISDNVVQGTPFSSRMLVVMQPNGKPGSGAAGTPRSPITTGGLLGGGYGIAIDPKGSVWVGNFGWGPVTNCLYYPTNSPGCNGSASQFTADGVAISGPLGYQGGPVRAQGLASDSAGNIWITSYGTDSVHVFLNGDPEDVVSLPLYAGSQPFDVQIGEDGTAWVSCGGGISGEYPSNLFRLQLAGRQLNVLWEAPFGKAIKGLSLDSKGNAWVASQGDSKVYAVAPDGTVLGGYGDGAGGVDGPWGATVDGEDHVWVANFGPLGLAPYASRLSKLAGADPETRPPGLRMGDPISPPTGYTVPTAGSQVLLHNGTPLYGTNAPPAYDPLQRLTVAGIDRAGNLWALNNWKNNFAVDFAENPGGDGIVIFVGIAAPPRRRDW
ncbi:MAG: hypothetical protein KF791_16760 [Verrucomicrobiae bacterium]|nr:hypothetical protein [Verrucomicrobiae bacterium]